MKLQFARKGDGTGYGNETAYHSGPIPPVLHRSCIMPPRKRARKVSNEPDTVKLETELEQLSCEQLRQELLDIGENPGPIDLATK